MTSTFTPERLRALLTTQGECEARDHTVPDGTGNHVCNALRDVAPELARELLRLIEADDCGDEESEEAEPLDIASLMENYPHEEAAKLVHDAFLDFHGAFRTLLIPEGVQTAAERTAKLIENALPGSLTPFEMAEFCITTYFGAAQFTLSRPTCPAPDPLRQRLGEAAITALMEGKAAVVPLIDKKFTGSIGNYELGYNDAVDEITELRLDKPTSEAA